MKFRTIISILVASTLALMAIPSLAGQGQHGASADRAQQVDRDRTYDRDRMSDRDRTQDRDRSDVPDQDRDRDRDRDRIETPDQDRDRDRIHDPANFRDQDIYGNEFMTSAECDQYRKELGSAKTREARREFQVRHEEKMQKRAMQQGQNLVPPGQWQIYGGEFMSVQERNEYRKQLRLFDSEAERQQFQAQHHEQMRERARVLNLEIEEAE